ncbi:MAG: CehA/McbA family metallohydrolase [Deltaproteobacteria bacterium]|nr:CehA/McbA family metallohydrolase [Deltaproteobacteria bacterium]
MPRCRKALAVALSYLAGALIAGCSESGSSSPTPGLTPIITVGPPQTPFTIQDTKRAIGGPLAQGRIGDQLLVNDQIRVVIQQPGKYPGVGSFGGNIIDADLVRSGGSAPAAITSPDWSARGSGFASPSVAGSWGSGGSAPAGEDQFGVILPMINVEWTVNGTTMFAANDFDPAMTDPEAIAAARTSERPAAGAPQVLVVQGVIDTYDYLDIDFLEPIAHALTGQDLHYDARFDDLAEPFTVTDLKQLRIDVTTVYRLVPGSRAVEIHTILVNDGDTPATLPVGDFVNGSGELELLIPGQGFTPPLGQQIANATPAVIYAGMPGVPVSYGYFFRSPTGEDGTPAKTTSLTYSGVTGVLLGEEFTKLFPIGGGTTPHVNFTVPARGRRSFVRYFVVGDGSAGSVLDEGLRVLGVATQPIDGHVADAAGSAIADATVAVLSESGATLVTYRTDAAGRFQGRLPTGADAIGKTFGTGRYTVRVDKPGYHESGTDRAGTCAPAAIDVTQSPATDLRCTLGAGGLVTLAGPVRDADSGQAIPARLTIVGADPSPDRHRPGIFHDQVVFERPFGIVDLLYLNARGGIGTTSQAHFRLEPGTYLVVATHGPEYSRAVLPVTVAADGIMALPAITLRRVAPTPGFIGADFHIHALASPDSAMAPTQRALAAAAEGLDVLHSSDHDYLFDYAPVLADLERQGYVVAGTMTTIVGDEISPNHLGHIHAYPLVPDPSRPNNGALDWSLSAQDHAGPDPDFMLSVQEIIDRIRQAPGGEKVIQVNHIGDRATSLFLLTGLVTSAMYRDSHHVLPFSTYADPIGLRLPAVKLGNLPLPMGGGLLFSPDFTAAELVIGSDLGTTQLRESTLPQWFNLLNLGLLVTATGDSDSHTPIAVTLGLPRNYVASPLDPSDGQGADMDALDPDAYAKAINAHRVVVSAGPFVRMTIAGEAGTAAVGEVVATQHPRVRVEVTAPEWAWFDTIELYANTIPTPVDDDGIGLLRGVAGDPAEFYRPYHIPRYVYEPTKSFRLLDGTLKEWTMEDGVIRAVVETELTVDHDTWVVAFARGTADTPGYRPLFPYAVRNRLGDDDATPTPLPPDFTMDDLAAHPALRVSAWAFTNPIFIDIDGDTNNDGDPFEALFVKQGISPLK